MSATHFAKRSKPRYYFSNYLKLKETYELLKQKTDRNGVTTTYEYDNGGQLIKENDVHYDYDLNGNVVKVTDKLGETENLQNDGTTTESGNVSGAKNSATPTAPTQTTVAASDNEIKLTYDERTYSRLLTMVGV